VKIRNGLEGLPQEVKRGGRGSVQNRLPEKRKGGGTRDRVRGEGSGGGGGVFFFETQQVKKRGTDPDVADSSKAQDLVPFQKVTTKGGNGGKKAL